MYIYIIIYIQLHTHIITHDIITFFPEREATVIVAAQVCEEVRKKKEERLKKRRKKGGESQKTEEVREKVGMSRIAVFFQ